MSELMQAIETLTKIVYKQNEDIHNLTLMVMKDKVDTTWIDERTTAQMLGLAPRTLREKVKGQDPLFAKINYRNTNGRSWQYSRKSVMSFKESTSTGI